MPTRAPALLPPQTLLLSLLVNHVPFIQKSEVSRLPGSSASTSAAPGWSPMHHLSSHGR
jgi:hypothetical protein